MSKTYEFESVKVMWAKLDPNNPEAPFMQADDNPKPDSWNLIAVLDDKQADKWKDNGMYPKFKRNRDHDLVLEDGKKTIKLSKTSTFGYNGAAKKPVIVVDTYGNPFTGLIGNGSVCNIQCSVHDWKGPQGDGSTATLEAIQVLELVEYSSDGVEDFTPTFSFDKQEKKSLSEVTADQGDEDIPF
jgi:hypothetical protein